MFLTEEQWREQNPHTRHSQATLAGIAVANAAAVAAGIPAPALPPYDFGGAAYPSPQPPPAVPGNASNAQINYRNSELGKYNEFYAVELAVRTVLEQCCGPVTPKQNGQRLSIVELIVFLRKTHPNTNPNFLAAVNAEIFKPWSVETGVNLQMHWTRVQRYMDLAREVDPHYNTNGNVYDAFVKTISHIPNVQVWITQYIEPIAWTARSVTGDKGLLHHLESRIEKQPEWGATLANATSSANAASSTAAATTSTLQEIVAKAVQEALTKTGHSKPKTGAGATPTGTNSEYCFFHGFAGHNAATCRQKELACHLLGIKEPTRNMIRVKPREDGTLPNADKTPPRILKTASEQEKKAAQAAIDSK